MILTSCIHIYYLTYTVYISVTPGSDVRSSYELFWIVPWVDNISYK